MARIVNVHHVDKEAFIKGNSEFDLEEVEIVFEHSPTYAELVERCKEELKWTHQNDVVELLGRHNVGFGLHIRWKIMRVNSELCWSAYKEVVAESQDKSLELFATSKVALDLNHSSPVQSEPHVASSPVRSEPHVALSHDEITQDSMTQHEFSQPSSPNANNQCEPSEEEYDENEGDMFDGELGCNDVGDVDAYCAQEDMTNDTDNHDKIYSQVYASDSDDDGPEEDIDEEGFTAKEAEVFKKVFGRDHRIPLFRDLSHADEAVVDGGTSIMLGPRSSSVRDKKAKEYGIREGLTFDTLLEFQIWIAEFAVKHFRPYKVVHSDKKKRFTVKCEDDGCPWIVCARPYKGGPQWHISSCVSTHMCSDKNIDDPKVKNIHRQLTSEFIGYKVSNSVKNLPTLTIGNIIDSVKELYGYTVKYGKAWKAKQAAFNMLYGDWEEAYNRLPRLLGAMAATNPGMVVEVEPCGSQTRTYNGATVRVFGRAFWAFDQCKRAFKHCRPVISIDGTFLTGQFKGTLLVAIGNDANNRLLPLAFALVSAENNDNWEWFMRLLRTKVIPPQREVCVISDRHQGILNAMEIDISGHARLHHRWCMRHFVANFYRACGNKDLSDRLKDCCLAYTEIRFYRLYNNLVTLGDLLAGGKEFLIRHESQLMKWARAFDDGGRRYGQMTSNMAECFNSVLKGVRALPVTAIVQYTFDKLREYFLHYSKETDKQIAGDNKKKFKFQYPPKVTDWIHFQDRKADTLEPILFDNEEWTYQVNEPGGTTSDGVQHGGKAFGVSLRTCDCSCQRPLLLHLACSHLRAAARVRHVDYNHPLTVRESEFTIETTKKVWAPRLHPYFDQSQSINITCSGVSASNSFMYVRYIRFGSPVTSATTSHLYAHVGRRSGWS